MHPPNYRTPESVVAKLNEIEDQAFIHWKLVGDGDEEAWFREAYATAGIPINTIRTDEPDLDTLNSWFPGETIVATSFLREDLAWLQFSIRD